MLKINHLNISYQNTPAVKDLSLAVGDGQIVGIAGESGSGKSTMLSSIIGLLGREGRITAGDILFEGRAADERQRTGKDPGKRHCHDLPAAGEFF